MNLAVYFNRQFVQTQERHGDAVPADVLKRHANDERSACCSAASSRTDGNTPALTTRLWPAARAVYTTDVTGSGNQPASANPGARERSESLHRRVPTGTGNPVGDAAAQRWTSAYPEPSTRCASDFRRVVDAGHARNVLSRTSYTTCGHRDSLAVLPGRAAQDEGPSSSRAGFRYPHARREHQLLTHGRVMAYGIDALD